MWSVLYHELPEIDGTLVSLEKESGPVTVGEFVTGLQADASFRAMFNAAIAGVPYVELRWEMPAIMVSTLSMPFECVLLNSPGLARRPNPEAFQEHFTDEAFGAVAFQNLNGDAMLVVPTPLVAPDAYGHLAAFVRKAPVAQQDALWKRVGEMVAQRIGTQPFWLSTAGAGVSWLHVRLDSRPKYFGYRPYRIVRERT
ncbi:MAG: DUF6940 family protein [Fimbriiglobus sp.]